MTRSASFAFTDPLPYQAAIRAAEVEVLVTRKGDFHGEATRIDFERLWMQAASENLPRVFRTHTSAERAAILFLIDADQGGIQHSGIPVRPGEIVVMCLGSSHYFRTSGPTRWGAMSLTPRDLAAAGLAMAGRELAPPSVTHVIRPDPELMARLVYLHRGAVHLARTCPEALAHPGVSRSLEQALILALVRCLAESAPVQMTSGHLHRLSIVKKFEELLAADHGRPLYLAEVCAAVGASERTLRASCQEHLGMGPVRYLWVRRMHLARRALLQAIPERATVTDIAMEHGFWELGRFAVEYRSLFGESPSVSLRRAPTELPGPKEGPFGFVASDSA